MTSEPQFLQAAFAANLHKLAVCPHSHLTVAVSGGLDSMVLLHLLAHIPAEARPQLTVAHLNHGLRESESAEDQRLVESACEQVGLSFVTKTLASGLIANVQKQTVEEAARSYRYQWLEETAVEVGATAIATGHHADDQAETVLHHLARGTGLRGLQGMLPDRKLPLGIRLLRPLLEFSRNQLQNYANWQQIAFREDSTNTDTRFTRNKIRHELLPTVSLKNGSTIKQQLNQLAGSAAEAINVLDRISTDLAEVSIITRTADHVLLRADSLASVPAAVRCHFFTWLWIQQSWPRQKMTVTHWNRLSEAVEMPSTRRFQLPGRVEMTRTDDWIRLLKSLGDKISPNSRR